MTVTIFYFFFPSICGYFPSFSQISWILKWNQELVRSKHTITAFLISLLGLNSTKSLQFFYWIHRCSLVQSSSLTRSSLFNFSVRSNILGPVCFVSSSLFPFSVFVYNCKNATLLSFCFLYKFLKTENTMNTMLHFCNY